MSIDSIECLKEFSAHFWVSRQSWKGRSKWGELTPKNKMVQPSLNWCLSFLIILIYLVIIPTAKKCRTADNRLSCLYLPLLFRLLNPVVSPLNDNGICNPASRFPALEETKLSFLRMLSLFRRKMKLKMIKIIESYIFLSTARCQSASFGNKYCSLAELGTWGIF